MISHVADEKIVLMQYSTSRLFESVNRILMAFEHYSIPCGELE